MDWQDAPDVKKDIIKILKVLDLPYINSERVFCYRTTGSRVRAYARTWAMPKIFQKALGIEPAYVIEVLEKYYDKQSEHNKKQILIHELLHIPKNFSGALAPHRNRSRVIHKEADRLFKEYLKKSI
jgi:predicted metallopeptidase